MAKNTNIHMITLIILGKNFYQEAKVKSQSISLEIIQRENSIRNFLKSLER
jgi:hypothetical protein